MPPGSGVKDLTLLGLELGVRENAGVPELAELFELGKLVVRARNSRRFRGLRLRVLRLGCGRRSFFRCGGLVLRGPPSLLATLDASGYGTGGSGYNCGSCDSTKQTWHGTRPFVIVGGMVPVQAAVSGAALSPSALSPSALSPSAASSLSAASTAARMAGPESGRWPRAEPAAVKGAAHAFSPRCLGVPDDAVPNIWGCVPRPG